MARASEISSQKVNEWIGALTLEDCSSPVSNDESNCVQSRPKTKQSHIKIENASELSVEQVQEILQLKFLERMKSPTFIELEKMSVSDLVDVLITFAYEEDGIPSEMALEEMWEKPDRFARDLKYLNENSHILVDLKDICEENINKIMDVASTAPAIGLLRSFIEYTRFKETGEVNFQVHSSHEMLKQVFSFLPQMSGFTSAGFLRYHGEAALSFERRPFPEDTAAEVQVKVLPDFILGSRTADIHCIPVQVFSPTHIASQKHQTTSAPTTEINDGSQRVQTKSQFCPDLSELPNELNERNTAEFYQKLCAQHVTQLFGIVEHYYWTRDTDFNHQTISPVIGICMMDGFIFFSKMKVGAYYIAARSKNPKYIYSPKLFHQSAPTVQFFPTAFNLKIGRHRLALAIFLTQHRLRFFPSKDLLDCG